MIKIHYWFTADTHFNHSKIIEYNVRPFKSDKHMDKTIIKNWNERVKKDDVVFFLGDFCFKGKNKAKKYLKKLHGNIIFIRGNHDNNNGVNAIIEYLVARHGGKEIYMCHDPKDFNPEYKLNLCGHIHKLWKIKRDKKYKTILVNVGTDCWDYRPISINDILECVLKFKRKEKCK